MFISILRAPAADSTAKNFSVIDIAAGYFAYLDYSTDSIFSFDLVQNIAQWARQAVSRAASEASGLDPTPPASEADIAHAMQDVYAHLVPEVNRCKI